MSKRIVMLQGPVGGYFRYLYRRLVAHGYDVRRLAFNGGDILFSLGQPFEIVQPRDGSYEAAIEEIIHEQPTDAVILFGDERPIHRAARQAAAHLGVPVFCLEEGYLRPDFITFELGGNNANSTLMESFDPAVDPPDPPKVPSLRNSTFPMARSAILYFCALRLSRSFFPHYRHHRERRLRSEFRYWNRAAWRRLMARRHDDEVTRTLDVENPSPFFIAALQVHDDLQLVRHGRDWAIRDFLKTVLDSFQRAAPADCRLVIKAHPLDVGYGHHRKALRNMVEESGLGGRVVFLQSGPLMPVVRRARGLVTINSTAGIAALEFGVPVLAFGDALYLSEGLAKRPEGPQDIDAFWTSPPQVDTTKAHRFKVHVRNRALIPGSFYLRDTWETMTDGVIERLKTTLGD